MDFSGKVMDVAEEVGERPDEIAKRKTHNAYGDFPNCIGQVLFRPGHHGQNEDNRDHSDRHESQNIEKLSHNESSQNARNLNKVHSAASPFEHLRNEFIEMIYDVGA